MLSELGTCGLYRHGAACYTDEKGETNSLPHPKLEMCHNWIPLRTQTPFAVQTRTGEGATPTYTSLEAALEAFKKDPTIWKISFPLPTGERFRMVRRDMTTPSRFVTEIESVWVMDLMSDHIKKVVEEVEKKS